MVEAVVGVGVAVGLALGSAAAAAAALPVWQAAVQEEALAAPMVTPVAGPPCCVPGAGSLLCLVMGASCRSGAMASQGRAADGLMSMPQDAAAPAVPRDRVRAPLGDEASRL